ncbi:hypothetical protein [Nitrosomonas communis]|uniref:hypothetical protein n=1 Tax=Nitrosomonas communis TaxID=44574 RepID=UPI003D2CB170
MSEWIKFNGSEQQKKHLEHLSDERMKSLSNNLEKFSAALNKHILTMEKATKNIKEAGKKMGIFLSKS